MRPVSSSFGECALAPSGCVPSAPRVPPDIVREPKTTLSLAKSSMVIGSLAARSRGHVLRGASPAFAKTGEGMHPMARACKFILRDVVHMKRDVETSRSSTHCRRGDRGRFRIGSRQRIGADKPAVIG